METRTKQMNLPKVFQWIEKHFPRLHPGGDGKPTAAHIAALQRINAQRSQLHRESDAQLHLLARRLHSQTWTQALLVDAFALAAETSERILGLRLFDVQILGALVLAEGKIAEMQTGEGKTLAAVPAIYMHALASGGVHVLTANDYLAKRDADWMGDIFRSLGLSVGSICQGMSAKDRRNGYKCDIVYATPNEVGFDFLRDRLCIDPEELVQQPFRCAVYDEVDSILIDESRIPLVIAGGDSVPMDLALRCAAIIRPLQSGMDYDTDEHARNVHLTDSGVARIEESLHCPSLYDLRYIPLLTAVQDALHAEVLLRRDVDYIVKGNTIELVDEFKGRVAENRRWPAGLQTAIEAKENLPLKKQGRILGSITLQNLAALYPLICGMTGTAATQAEEFFEIYGLNVVVIPTNRPMIRIDYPDRVFRTINEKEIALVEEITGAHSAGRPVLVGTASVAESERLSELLDKAAIPHDVLNARNDEAEANIISQAGSLGAVTISTNMAGRGTDIPLGGTPPCDLEKIIKLGGLYVIGINRHESRRIDHQLRGRSGRQGDPGSSRFFISLEDALMRRFGICDALEGKMPEGEAIEHVQRFIEGQNLDIRKTLLKYEQIIESQRQIIQTRRSEAQMGVGQYRLETQAPELYDGLAKEMGSERLAKLEQSIVLTTIDESWSDYLAEIAELRSGIHWISYGGKDPLSEYLHEVMNRFEALVSSIDELVLNAFSDLQLDEKGEWIGMSRIDRGATWTYVVNDQPFGTMDARVMKGLVQLFRRSIPAVTRQTPATPRRGRMNIVWSKH
jgi:preprotein translocase subunit SecA